MKRFNKAEQENFKKLLYSAFNDKEVRCNHCEKTVKFTTREEYEQSTDKSPYILHDCTMICKNCNFDDDITQAHVIYKNGEVENLQDFYLETNIPYDIESPEKLEDIINVIQRDLADRKRTPIMKSSYKGIAEERAKLTQQKLNSLLYTEIDTKDGIPSLIGRLDFKGKEDTGAEFCFDFSTTENLVTLSFFIEGINVYKNCEETILRFCDSILTDAKVNRLADEYDGEFALVGNETRTDVGAINLKYKFKEFDEMFIFDTLFTIFKSAAKNIHNIGNDDIDSQIDMAEKNAKIYIYLQGS